MDALPDEIVIHIFKYLNNCTIINFGQTAKRFRILSNDDSIWKFKCYWNSINREYSWRCWYLAIRKSFNTEQLRIMYIYLQITRKSKEVIYYNTDYEKMYANLFLGLEHKSAMLEYREYGDIFDDD